MAQVTLAPAADKKDRLSVAALCSDDTPEDAPASGQSTPSKTNKNLPSSEDTDGLDIQDESVRIAVHALGDMRSGSGLPKRRQRPPLHLDHDIPVSDTASYQSTPSLSLGSSSSPSTTSEPPPSLGDEAGESKFVGRVTAIPLFNSALRAYGYTKSSSRVVKYGAEMMESSVKSISRPVMDRLPVEQLDDFACRQLDRLGRYRRGSSSQPSKDEQIVSIEERHRGLKRGREAWSELNSRMRDEDGRFSRDTSLARSGSVTPSEGGWSEAGPSRFRFSSPGVDEDEDTSSDAKTSTDSQKQVVARSKWQAMLLEAGGIGAAVSEESMKKLKYCLQWLQYATAHIDQQILLLRSFIASLNPNSSDPSSPNSERVVPIQSLQTLTEVKKDLVSTIRQVVDVVSKYAGGSLPEPARATVRSFILRLPERWATAARAEARINGLPASPSSTATSPRSPEFYRTSPEGQPPTATTAAQAAERVLTLATESLDMMRSVTAVFKESLDKAEAWVERLRIIGIQRQQSGPTEDPGSPSSPPVTESFTSMSLAYDPTHSPTSPPPRTLSTDEADAPLRKRRATKKGVGKGGSETEGEGGKMDLDG